MSEFLQVAEDEGEEPIELPIEEDSTLLLSTLQAQFPSACGLKYRNPDTKAIRGIRLNEGKFYPPSSESGWGMQIYFCVFPKENKRKNDDCTENSVSQKTRRVESRLRCTDLIVLGLPWKTTEQSLREHFKEFGEVLMAQVKKDVKSGQSKGFGFIRFGSYEVQMRVLATKHLIDGRLCEVKVPNSKEGSSHQVPCKVFVGRCTEDLTADDLKEYFSKFGEVTDVFIPRPFRAFSFVTFLDPEVAQKLCGEDHVIKGVSVHVSNASPKSDQNRNNLSFNHSYINSSICGGGGGSGGSLGINSSLMKYRNSGNNGGGGILSVNNCRIGDCNDSNNLNRQESVPYTQRGGSYMQNLQMAHNNGWHNQNRNNLDLPNLQALSITPQRQNSSPNPQTQNVNNILGFGLNLNSLPMNPAVVAAALNRWSLVGSQDQVFGQSGNQNSQSGNSQSQSGFSVWLNQRTNSNSDGNQQGGGGSNHTWPRQPSGTTAAPQGSEVFL